jgi:transposase-like protein
MLMANPIVMAAAFARLVPIKCPHCRHHKLVERIPKAFRVCPRCHKHFPDPISARRKAKR